jgi:hypothetical protein
MIRRNRPKEFIPRAILSGIQATLAEFPFNDHFWTRTFTAADGDEYLTRSLFPRVLGYRPVIHKVHRDDKDPYPHNHPWKRAWFRIVTGGYTDERWYFDDSAETPWQFVKTVYRPGDVNHIWWNEYHRLVDVLSGTMTVGLLGPKVQEFGFMSTEGLGQFIPWRTYIEAGGGFFL